MVTEEEKREIIERAKEEFLLALPELIGNLITNHVTMSKMNSDFYKEHPEFKGHKDIIASALELVDGEDTLLPYEDKLKRALPIAQQRLSMLKNTDMDKVSGVPNRNFSDVGGSNGVL